jgi:hypothetical protein
VLVPPDLCGKVPLLEIPTSSKSRLNEPNADDAGEAALADLLEHLRGRRLNPEHPLPKRFDHVPMDESMGVDGRPAGAHAAAESMDGRPP